MQKLLYILIFFTVSAKAQLHKMAADTEFFYTYGGTNKDEARDIKETYDKGYIMVGTTGSFGQGAASAYIIKTDNLGKHVWSSVQGGSQNDYAYSVELTPDSGFFVAGYSNSFSANSQFYNSPYYFKLDKKGSLVWQKTVDASSWSFIYNSCTVADSGFILCGQTYATTDGSADAYLIRLNKNGDTLWTKHYGGIQDETFNSVCIINNRIYAVGSNSTHPADTASDGWITKLDMNGNLLQDTFVSFGATAHQQEILNGITPYSTNTFYACGQSNIVDSNTVGAIRLKTDTALNIISSSVVLPLKGEVWTLNKVLNRSYGGTVVVGTKSGGAGALGMYFVGFDSNDNYITDYSPTDGGSQNDYGYSGVYTSQGRVIGVGSTLSTSEYCTNPNLGLEDFFLIRYNSDSIHTNNVKVEYNCYSDTLFLWQASIKNYFSDGVVTLFPNPVSSNATLKLQDNFKGLHTAKVYSLMGEEILTLNIGTSKETVINFSSLSTGSYFLKIQDSYGNNISVIKFIVIY